MIRRLVPTLLVPLGLIACVLASSPWLRAFPSAVLAVPLFGAAVLGFLVPVVVVGIGVRRLWLTALIDVVVYLFFTTLVALHDPVGFNGLYHGLLDGPSQILTFALPLVSPRTLLVAPVTLCWISAAILGECIGRSWHSVLPYATLMITFAITYAGSVRGITTSSDGRRYDTLLAGALLLVLLLMRAIEAWLEQDLESDSAQPEGVLPLRGLAVGALVALLVAAVAGVAVQASAFSGPPAAPARTPPLTNGQPLSPLAFVAGLRPHDPQRRGSEVFQVRTNRPSSGYIAIADVDSYDGDGWSFDRTFRPSGGIVPAESDPALRAPGPAVTQQYTIGNGALTRAPWMPFLYRPQRVSGTGIDVDSASGMIVPAVGLRAGDTYSVTSRSAATSFADLGSTSFPATSTPTQYTFVPGSVSSSLSAVVSSFEKETGTGDGLPVAFLQALARDLQRNYSLAGGTAQASRTAPSTDPTASAPATDSASPGRSATSGGTGFANVLASILGPDRVATPEQYATLVALVARQLGVPAQLVSGFRISASGHEVPAGNYRVTTAQAWTWVEIPIQGKGWVVLDPSPHRYSVRRAHQSGRARPSSSPTPSLTPNGLTTQSDRGHAVAPKSAVPGSGGAGATPWLVLALVALSALAVTLVLALVLRKRVRARRRRRTGDPRRRLVAAWHESLDILVEAGLPDPANLTSAEVAAATEQLFGGASAAQARYIGDCANAAIFSPTSWVGSAEAEAVWRAETVLQRSVLQRLSMRERAGVAMRYHRTRRPRAVVGPTSWASTAAGRVRSSASGRPGRHSGGSRRRRVH